MQAAWRTLNCIKLRELIVCLSFDQTHWPLQGRVHQTLTQAQRNRKDKRERNRERKKKEEKQTHKPKRGAAQKEANMQLC